MFGLGFPELIIIIVILCILAIPVWLLSKILDKAGFSGWFSLLGIIPIVNIIALWVFAFISWPAEQ
ncbi:MAG: hypothetical protein WGN25_12310 [Candidatus Electrothrix sp. GW3-4]|uniref:hypothetical protein n=1 Tax=Candidatus Electrothrix sp. GW3-4 TaxID=3126740 RepID=UPI0030CAD8AF